MTVTFVAEGHFLMMTKLEKEEREKNENRNPSD